MQSTETWLPVPGYEVRYEVSNAGRVRSRVSGRVLKPYSHVTSGHLTVGLSRDGWVKRCYLHRLILEAFIGPAPQGTEGCHNDGHVLNNRLSNLRWDTRSANNLDAVSHGTHYSAAKTHCPRHHALQEPNLNPSHLNRGKRACQACCQERWAASSQHRSFDPAQADERYRALMGPAEPELYQRQGNRP